MGGTPAGAFSGPGAILRPGPGVGHVRSGQTRGGFRVWGRASDKVQIHRGSDMHSERVCEQSLRAKSDFNMQRRGLRALAVSIGKEAWSSELEYPGVAASPARAWAGGCPGGRVRDGRECARGEEKICCARRPKGRLLHRGARVASIALTLA